jgi:hypothetical protein
VWGPGARANGTKQLEKNPLMLVAKSLGFIDEFGLPINLYGNETQRTRCSLIYVMETLAMNTFIFTLLFSSSKRSLLIF